MTCMWSQADATVTPTSLLQKNPQWFILTILANLDVPGKQAIKQLLYLEAFPELTSSSLNTSNDYQWKKCQSLPDHLYWLSNDLPKQLTASTQNCLHQIHNITCPDALK